MVYTRHRACKDGEIKWASVGCASGKEGETRHMPKVWEFPLGSPRRT